MPLRPYTTDLPAPVDLEFLTNSDKDIPLAWNHTDGTGVPVSSAVFTLEFDVSPPVNGDPPAEPTRLVIDSYDPANVDGYIDPERLGEGIITIVVRHTAWMTIVERSGNHDVQAVSAIDDRTRVLIRGIFTVTEGIS